MTCFLKRIQASGHMVMTHTHADTRKHTHAKTSELEEPQIVHVYSCIVHDRIISEFSKGLLWLHLRED